MQDNAPLTIGVDHVGLAVKNLESARRFFCACLGWKLVGENQSYPASFVSDGNGIVTLWQVEGSGEMRVVRPPPQRRLASSCIEGRGPQRA